MKSHIFSSVLFIVLLDSFAAYCQSAKEQNPVIFGEGFTGFSGGIAGGLLAGLEVNYQIKKNLFSFRYSGTIRLSVDIVSPFVPIPVISEKSSHEEVAVLYGRRFINNAHAFSFSLGLCLNKLNTFSFDSNSRRLRIVSKYPGLPFEANVNWFKKEKQRLRLYGLIPIGRPTALGSSIGFKFFGNISKYSSAGLAITLGFGYLKKY